MGDEPLQRVMAASSHYEIFGLGVGVYDETTVRKEYRKLAVKLHPDKNPDPAAKEAFQRVGDALQTLTDTAKRIRYDLEMQSRPQPGSSQHQQPHYQQQHVPNPGYWPPAGAASYGAASYSGASYGGAGQMSLFGVQCGTCMSPMQFWLPNNFTPCAVSHLVSCPACGGATRVDLPPMPIPTGMPGWSNWGYPCNGAGGGASSSAGAGGANVASGRGAGRGAARGEGAAASATSAARAQRKEAERAQKALDKLKADKARCAAHPRRAAAPPFARVCTPKWPL